MQRNLGGLLSLHKMGNTIREKNPVLHSKLYSFWYRVLAASDKSKQEVVLKIDNIQMVKALAAELETHSGGLTCSNLLPWFRSLEALRRRRSATTACVRRLFSFLSYPSSSICKNESRQSHDSFTSSLGSIKATPVSQSTDNSDILC